MKPLYTPKEIATIIGVSYRKVLNLIAAEELSAFKVGKVYKISEVSLMQYLESTRTSF